MGFAKQLFVLRQQNLLANHKCHALAFPFFQYFSQKYTNTGHLKPNIISGYTRHNFKRLNI